MSPLPHTTRAHPSSRAAARCHSHTHTSRATLMPRACLLPFFRYGWSIGEPRLGLRTDWDAFHTQNCPMGLHDTKTLLGALLLGPFSPNLGFWPSGGVCSITMLHKVHTHTGTVLWTTLHTSQAGTASRTPYFSTLCEGDWWLRGGAASQRSTPLLV